MADKDRIVKNIKNGGTLAIFVGTASLMKPIIPQNNENRNPVEKACAVASGTAISLGLANFASNFFGKIVDEVVRFIDDVKTPKKEDRPNG